MRKAIIMAAILLVASPVSAEYVTAPEGLNVRTKPSTAAEVVEVLKFGSEVDGCINRGWMKLNSGKGYICAEYTGQENPFDSMEYMGEWRITAYAYTGSPCANGNYPTTGYTVACNALPFGTEVYIDGVGFRTVEDTDGGRMGNEWIDLYLGDVNECIQWGDQYRGVWIK